MTMDRTAIEQIENTAVRASGLDCAFNTHTPVALIPKDLTLTSMEHYQKGRSRFRGTFVTSAIASFVAYIGDHTTEDGAACFIDGRSMAAKAIFNLGSETDPGHADHLAELKLRATAPFDEVLTFATGRRMSQTQLAEWFEDWRTYITIADQNGDTMTPQQAAAAARRITIEASRKADHEEGQFSANRSTLEQIQARSETALPAGITFTTVPFLGLVEREFFMRVSIVTSGDKPEFMVRLTQLEQHEEAMAEDLEAEIRERVTVDGVGIYTGAFTA